YFLNLEGIDIGGVTPPQLYIAMMPDVKLEGYKLINSLRTQGISVETDYMGKSVKAQMKYANKIHAPYVIVLGADEIASGKVRIKNMEDGSETEASIDAIADIVK
ncbi:MAG: His/Gly/Thr/Pro-type tRNA ligase C-terminal domain-containing protein, partial [Lachnospiraceae bacterium]|nr:His/Gly/Thr/Pro-type tRNA ligase C-terminal domain-containing protein [Lachnospiraceae bacterium]